MNRLINTHGFDVIWYSNSNEHRDYELSHSPHISHHDSCLQPLVANEERGGKTEMIIL